MSDETTTGRSEDGFEWNGHFYPWRVSDKGKDLLLIDRIAQMPVNEFFELVEDSFDRNRAPVLLALVATSLRAGHPQWSHQRIERIVMGLSLSDDLVFVDGDEEEDESPPVSGGEEPPTALTDEPEPPSESSPSPTPEVYSESGI